MNFPEGFFPGAVAWGLFFATSAFGHVALKRAAGAGGSYDLARSVDAIFSGWGVAAMIAWAVSAWAWTYALTRYRLIDANAIAAIRIVACVALAALWLGERIGPRELAGTALVALGAWLLRG